MGGVGGALASHADRVIADLGQGQQSLARSVLLRLVTPERTRAIVPVDELRRAVARGRRGVQRLIDQMVSTRACSSCKRSTAARPRRSSSCTRRSSRGWPMLRRWLDENQDDAALVDQLHTAARQWQQKGRDPGVLWRGEAADEAQKFRKRYKGPLSDVERAFLDEVVSLRDRDGSASPRRGDRRLRRARRDRGRDHDRARGHPGARAMTPSAARSRRARTPTTRNASSRSPTIAKRRASRPTARSTRPRTSSARSRRPSSSSTTSSISRRSSWSRRTRICSSRSRRA